MPTQGKQIKYILQIILANAFIRDSKSHSISPTDLILNQFSARKNLQLRSTEADNAVSSKEIHPTCCTDRTRNPNSNLSGEHSEYTSKL